MASPQRWTGWVLPIVMLAAGLGYVVGSERSAPVGRGAGARVLPASGEAWTALAEAAEHDGRLDEARVALHAATAFDTAGERHLRLGFFLYEHGDWDAAGRALEAARGRGHTDPMLAFTLASMKRTVETDGLFPRFHDKDTDAGPAPAVAADDLEEPRDAGVDAGAPDAGPQRFDDDGDDDAEDDRDSEGDAEPEPGHADDEPVGAPQQVTPQVAAAPACGVAIQRRGRSGTFVADVSIDGHTASLIIDTGASLTVLARSFVDESDLDLDEDDAITARTAAGLRRFPTALVAEVGVGDQVAGDIRVAVCEGCGGHGVDGLLGLDVMTSLGLSLDPGRGILRCDG